jgi:hypothetical protein
MTMDPSTDPDRALALLQALEDGTADAHAARALAEQLDPVLVYSIVRYLREAYPASNPAARAVLERVVRLTTVWPALVETSRRGENDPVSRWFAGAHDFPSFRGRGREMIETLVDKLGS